MESNYSPSPNSKDKIVPVKLYAITHTPENCDETLAPIIFIPGVYSTNRTFTHVRYEISKRTKRKIFAIELRNHGLSEYSDDFTLCHCIADLENFMETSNIPKAVLAGHSMGGRQALAMALKHPEKIEKVIVEDTNVVFSKPTKEWYMKTLLLIRFLNRKLKELPSNASESEAQRVLMPHFQQIFPKVVQNFSKVGTQFRLPLYTNASGKVDWEFNADVMFRNYIDQFEMDLSLNPIYPGDTLVLSGEHSISDVQNDLEIFYKHFPNLTCEVLPNAFHTYHVECADLYIKLVSKFIGEVEV